MRILLGAASHAVHLSGIQRHAFNLARCLLTQPEVTMLHVVVAPWQQRLAREAGIECDRRVRIHAAEMIANPLSQNFWYYRKLPEVAARLDVDLAHLTYPVPLRPAALRRPAVVTLHDLYPYEIPGNFGFPKYLVNRLILRQCVRNADAIACVSDSTRLRLGEYAPPAVSRKATRIYNCVEPQIECAAHAPIHPWRGEPFLLCVAQHRRNKNLPFVLRTFDRLRRSPRVVPGLRLLIVGIAARETRSIWRLVCRLNLGNQVVFLEGLPEDELQWCYTRCEALVAPSLAEGFGLPVAEALLAGCRVVCSDIPAHREVGEGRCRFVACGRGSEAAFAQALLEAWQAPKPPPALFPQYSAAILGRQYIRLYQQLIDGYRVSGERRAGGEPAPDLSAGVPWSVVT